MDVSTQQLYAELRLLARSMMRSERKNHTLSPTDLFHEAYARIRPRLVASIDETQDAKALFAATMRRVLIDHARKRCRRERKLAQLLLPVPERADPRNHDQEKYQAEKLVLLESVLQRFAERYPEHAKLVEYKYFGGMTIPQCAKRFQVSEATIERRWSFSRAWIVREMILLERT